MKLLNFKHFGLLLVLTFCILSSIYGQEYALTVQVSNIKEKKGKMIVSIFNNLNDYLKEGKEYCKKIIVVKDSIIKYTFKKLPKGAYAVALYHDVNEDGRCNKSLIGVPKEGFGFSKNKKPFIGAPSFDDVKIDLSQDKSIIINLIHY